MPQARSGGSSRSGTSRSSSGGGTRRSRASSSRSSSGAASTRSGRSTAGRRTTAKRSTTGARSTTTRPKPGSPEARVEAAANRVRKLNEQIIETGKQAGETTLTSYEKFLKSIASSLERGPGKSDVEWISSLATAQAKFIRDVTTSFTKAARKRLK
jgi:hypothetical protein